MYKTRHPGKDVGQVQSPHGKISIKSERRRNAGIKRKQRRELRVSANGIGACFFCFECVSTTWHKHNSDDGGGDTGDVRHSEDNFLIVFCVLCERLKLSLN